MNKEFPVDQFDAAIVAAFFPLGQKSVQDSRVSGRDDASKGTGNKNRCQGRGHSTSTTLEGPV